MAKKHHKKRGSRRRVGGMSLNPGSMMVKGAAVVAGYLFADTINAAIDKANIKTTPATATTAASMTARLSATSLLGIEGGLGALLLFSKSKRGAIGLIKTGAGGLLLGAGIKRGLKTFGVISGYQNVPVVGRRSVRGYQNTPVIGNAGPAQLAGPRPPQMGGFRVNGPGYVPVGSGARMGSMNPPNPAVASMPAGASGYMN